MRRSALNASPRGKNSNSRVILSWMAKGIAAAAGEELPIIDLARHLKEAIQALVDADEFIVALPLYTDAVPGMVTEFLEGLARREEEESDVLAGKRIVWVIHSGFPESGHSEPVAAWLKRATTRLGMVCPGVIIMGGSEGTRMMPEAMTAKRRRAFESAGAALVTKGHFDEDTLAALAKPRHFNLTGRLVIRLMVATGLMNFYWNGVLKKNRAWERRFDAPYGEPYGTPHGAGL